MHHEVLLAAVGCPGDIIVPTALGGGYKVAPDISFLSPAERAATDRVVGLGAHYARLQAFVDRHRYGGGSGGGGLGALAAASENKKAGGSLYLQALSAGVDELLAEYEAAVAALERECIAEPHLPTSHLHHALAKGGWTLTLPLLAAVVERVERRGLRGARVLELLHAEALSGSPRVKATVERLLQRVQAVFLHQAKRWCLEGDLSADPCGEFFVAPATVIAQDATPTTPLHTNPHNHTNTNEEEDDGQENDDDEEYEWGGRFSIAWDRAPLMADFSAALAERAFFLGRAVRILYRYAATTQQSPDSASTKHHRRRSLTIPQPQAAATAALTPDDIRELTAQWDSVLMQAAKERRPVCGWEVEGVVQATYRVVAQRLLGVVMGAQGLLGELEVIRALFLCGAGGAFHPFISHPSHRLHLLSPSRGNALDLAAGFASIVVAGYEEEAAQPTTNLSGRLWLTLESPEDAPGFRPRLEFRTRCPLILTREALATYNALFARLLEAKRLSFELERLWPLLIRKAEDASPHKQRQRQRRHQQYAAHLPSRQGGKQQQRKQQQQGAVAEGSVVVGPPPPTTTTAAAAVWTPEAHAMMRTLYALRARVAYVVDGLMYHWQAEVIDASYQELRAVINEAGDFEGVAALHRAFYLRLAARCFVAPGEALRPVKQALEALLASARRLTVIAEDVVGRDPRTFTPAFIRGVRREAGEIHVAFLRQATHLRLLVDGLPEGRELSVRLATAIGESA